MSKFDIIAAAEREVTETAELASAHLELVRQQLNEAGLGTAQVNHILIAVQFYGFAMGEAYDAAQTLRWLQDNE